MGLFKALKKAANWAGRQVKKGAKELSHAAGSVPIVGKPLKGIVDITITSELNFLGGAMDGERIDRAGLRSLKTTVQAVRDVAPYAQMVISMVPGIGTVAAASIAAGLALAQGQPINAAIIAGVRGAVPGGAMGTAVFDVSVSLGRGESVDKALINATPGLSKVEKKALLTVSTAVKAVANGKRVDDAAYEAAMKHLPKSARIAVQSGVAIGKGASVQGTMKKAAVKVVPGLAKSGAKKIAASASLGSSTKNMKKDEKHGANTAVGLMQKQAKPIEVQVVRSVLDKSGQAGFDLALAVVVGKNEKPGQPETTDEAVENAIVQGAQAFTPTRLVQLESHFSSDELLRASIATARVKVETKSWWRELLEELFT
jgi:hypothetical protein